MDVMGRQQKRLTFAIHDLNSWGGHDRSTLEIARRLSHRFGVDLFVYSITDPQGLESWGDVRIFKVWPYFKKPAFALITYFYLASLVRFGIYKKLIQSEKTVIHATGACSLVSDIVQVQFVNSAWKDLKKKLPEGLYQAPHSRTHHVFKRAIIQTYHEGMLHYDSAIERLVYCKDKTYIAISQQVKRELKKYFGLSDQVHVIHHGVDGKAFCPVNDDNRRERDTIRQSLGIKPDEVVIAFVGAYERKGLSIAIEAVGKLPVEIQNRMKLLAVGSGAVEGFRARAKELGISERICFVQHVRHVAPYYRASDVFLLPTFYEPFGLVITEALASGLPSIVSAQAGGAELIRHGESGFLINDPLRFDDITQLLSQVITDANLRKKVGLMAREVAEQRSWEQVANEYAHIIEPLLIK